MQSEIVASIIGALIQVIGGGIGGFLIAYFTIVRQQRIKKVEYELSSISLLESKRVSKSPLNVSVDKSIITGDDNDKGIPLNIQTAFAFSIKITNTGNETITDPCVEVRLDEQSIVVGYEYDPDYWAGRQPNREANSSSQNILRVTFPYINRNETITLNVTSIQNKSSDCQIRVLGPDVSSSPRKDSEATSLRSFLRREPEKAFRLGIGTLLLLFYVYLLVNPETLNVLTKSISLLLP